MVKFHTGGIAHELERAEQLKLLRRRYAKASKLRNLQVFCDRRERTVAVTVRMRKEEYGLRPA